LTTRAGGEKKRMAKWLEGSREWELEAQVSNDIEPKRCLLGLRGYGREEVEGDKNYVKTFLSSLGGRETELAFPRERHWESDERGVRGRGGFQLNKKFLFRLAGNGDAKEDRGATWNNKIADGRRGGGTTLRTMRYEALDRRRRRRNFLQNEELSGSE